MNNFLLACFPLAPCLFLIYLVKSNDVKYKIYQSIVISIVSYILTVTTIPVVLQYTKKRGLSGKDLGKKGTIKENDDIPEALGLVCGIVFIMSTIISQLLFANDLRLLVIYNSALFSICFMVFLGFIDDVLDLKWRYKLILPTIASLPLLSTYSGSTAVYIPEPFTALFMNGQKYTYLGYIINIFATVDSEANGRIIELGYWFLLFMGLLAVFCTNAINILAGINGLECGQSYVIACSIFFFKLYEITYDSIGENQIFAITLIIPFIGTSLGLLRYNWYPAKVFVGDTYCYFAGMTFAVIGIHGHFSKTLLLLFLPQIINFIYSIPQLFKLVPCPRHRLPKIDLSTHLMIPSTFPCGENEYKLIKVKSNDKECPNLTIICLVLRLFGPLHEKTLCIVLLSIQIFATIFTFYIRYYLLASTYPW